MAAFLWLLAFLLSAPVVALETFGPSDIVIEATGDCRRVVARDNTGTQVTLGCINDLQHMWFAAGEAVRVTQFMRSGETTIDHALRRAVEHVTATGGGIIRFPASPSCYLEESPFLYTGKNISFLGDDAATSCIRSSFDGDVWKIGDGIANPANTQIKGLTFDSSITRRAGASIAVRNGYNIEINDVICAANQAICLDLHGGEGPSPNQYGYYVRKLRSFSGLIGMRVGAESQVADLYYSESNMGNQTIAGVNLQSVSGFYSSRNDSQSNATNWLVNPGDGQSIQAILSTTDVLDSAISGPGLDISPTGSGNIANSTWTNLWSATNKTSGIKINGTLSQIRGLTFSGCQITNNGQHGVAVPSGAFLDFFACAVNDNNTSMAAFLGRVSGTTLTVTEMASGQITVGQVISGAGITAGTAITALGTGLGRVGTYSISASHNLGSEPISAQSFYSGYAFGPGASHFNVMGGRAGHGSGANTGRQANGITIASGATHYCINGPDLSGNTMHPLLDAANDANSCVSVYLPRVK